MTDHETDRIIGKFETSGGKYSITSDRGIIGPDGRKPDLDELDLNLLLEFSMRPRDWTPFYDLMHQTGFGSVDEMEQAADRINEAYGEHLIVRDKSRGFRLVG